MKKSLYDYGDVHAGEIIYIIGSSPSINYLSESDKEFLKSKITIGVNLAFEGIENMSYAVSAHIANAVYAFEHGAPNMPVFVDFGGSKKKEAFSYMKDFFWDDDRIVEFISSPPHTPLQNKNNAHDTSLAGNTSILLLATHLAYIMGAQKIVYMGFEEICHAHFWNFNKVLEKKMRERIEEIIESRKYWNDRFYNSGNMDVHYNVHRELELLLGKVPGFTTFFDLTPEEYQKPFWSANQPPPSHNIQNFSRYINFLNQEGIKTSTLSHNGVTIEAGCKKFSLETNKS